MSGERRFQFIYLDSGGQDVRLSEEAALEAGIRHGTITRDTLLFDADFGGWARAECHPVFGRVASEGGLPDVPDSGHEETGEADITELWRFPARFDNEGPREEGRDSRTPRPEELPSSGSDPVDDGQDPLDLSLELRADVGEDEAPSQAPSAASPGEDQMSGAETGDVPERASRAASPPGPSGADSGPAPIVPASPGVDPALMLPSWEGAELRVAPSDDGEPIPHRARVRVGVLSVAAVATVAAGFILTGGGPASLGGQPEARLARGAEPVSGEADAARNLVRPAGLSERIRTMMEWTEGDVKAGVRRVIQSHHLPEAPPAIWLDGRYLAEATRYPEVPAYWAGVGHHLERVEGAIPGVVERSYRARIEEARFKRATGAIILEQAMDRLARSDSLRAAALGPLEEMVAASLDLHRLLSEHEDDIAYRPYSGPELSEDPVLEAVPGDSILDREMWEAIQRVTEALESADVLETPTTAKLTHALEARLLPTLSR